MILCSPWTHTPTHFSNQFFKLLAKGKWNERINGRVQTWRFSFASADGRQRLQAIRDAAAFIQKHAAAFPDGRVPTEPTSIAVLAIKVHPVFLSAGADSSPGRIANAIVEASRRFG